MRGLYASLSIFVLTIGCSETAPPQPHRTEQKVENQAALVTIQFQENGRPATSCAGVLVGPQAVLTAGHCASKKYRAVIVAPNAGGKKSTSSRAWWFDWTDEATPKSSPQLHDVAILALDTPIELSSYPKIAQSSLPDGSKTVHVRRVKGERGIRFEAVSGRSRGAKNDKEGAHHTRISTENDKLDSGGAVFDPETGEIVGVISARAGSGVLHVSKTKALTKWLKQQLLALLKNPPKKPDAGKTESTPKPPSSGQSAPPAPKSGGMGKQSGGGTKSPKSGGSKSQNQSGKDPNQSKDDPEKDPNQDKECEGGDLECENNCEGGGDECETECEGGDDSCESPECEEGEGCECDGDECDGDIENEQEGDEDEYGDGDGDYGDDSGGDDYGGDE